LVVGPWQPRPAETLLLQALTELPRATAADVPVGRWNIPARDPDFTGRTELLGELDTTLVTGGRAVVQAVTGMGGVGKTSTATVRAPPSRPVRHRLVDSLPRPGRCPERLAALAHALGLADPTDRPRQR
jgi:hypothetical protein